MKRSFRLQSAMEYLMTYGWAILIIAVVLGVLYQMGVFNSSSLTVRAPPGACQVLRTSAAANLVGQCSGLLPKYVAQFDGQSSYIDIPQTTALSFPSNQYTAAVWFYNSGGSPWTTLLSKVLWNNGQGWILNFVSTWYLKYGYDSAGLEVGLPTPTSVSLNQWHQVIITNNNGAAVLYLDGTNVAQGTVTMSNANLDLLIGARSQNNGVGVTDYFYGALANVQIYNTSLDASSVKALYLEGIGGVPVSPSNVIDWWPLNGDTKDYSGNNNNGAPTAVTYSSQYGK